jgi:excisionase family DNA binding protein
MTRELAHSDVQPLWDVGDLMIYLGVSDTTVYQLVHEGRIPAVRIRQRLRFDPAEVRAAFREQRA